MEMNTAKLRKTAECVYIGIEDECVADDISSKLNWAADEIDRLNTALSQTKHYQEERNTDCYGCYYKQHSSAWEYYTYPCSECRRRTKDHFADAALHHGKDERFVEKLHSGLMESD